MFLRLLRVLRSPYVLQPLPKVAQGKKRVSRNRGKTIIITSSPYKAELETIEDTSQQNLSIKRVKIGM